MKMSKCKNCIKYRPGFSCCKITYLYILEKYLDDNYEEIIKLENNDIPDKLKNKNKWIKFLDIANSFINYFQKNILIRTDLMNKREYYTKNIKIEFIKHLHTSFINYKNKKIYIPHVDEIQDFNKSDLINKTLFFDYDELNDTETCPLYRDNKIIESKHKINNVFKRIITLGVCK
jgi:hypothetical protein